MKWFFFIVVAGTALLGWLYYNKMSEGFSLHEITSSLGPQYHYPTAPLEASTKAELEKIVSQPFYYLSKGCQFYAFESQDQKYIIKFFKHKHLRPLTWLPNLGPRIQERKAKKEEKIRALLHSCHLAYEKIPEVSGLLFVHLNKEPFFQKVVVITDKLGRAHPIKIDDYEFLIQKRAVTLKTHFQSLDAQQMAVKIEKLAYLIARRAEAGVGDHDPAFAQNVAFQQEDPLYIDVGQLYLLQKLPTQEEVAQEVKARLGDLKHFMEKNFPENAHLVDRHI